MDRNPHGVKGHFEDSAGVKLASAPAIYGKVRFNDTPDFFVPGAKKNI